MRMMSWLCLRNAEGCTPFMQAICSRAYPAALYILDTARRIAMKDQQDIDRDLLMLMLYPPGSSLDNSPLHVLCCNDMCSFTWTGDEHINQVRWLNIVYVTLGCAWLDWWGYRICRVLERFKTYVYDNPLKGTSYINIWIHTYTEDFL